MTNEKWKRFFKFLKNFLPRLLVCISNWFFWKRIFSIETRNILLRNTFKHEIWNMKIKKMFLLNRHKKKFTHFLIFLSGRVVLLKEKVAFLYEKQGTFLFLLDKKTIFTCLSLFENIFKERIKFCIKKEIFIFWRYIVILFLIFWNFILKNTLFLDKKEEVFESL